MNATLDYVVSTGDFIAEWMESEGINAAELSRRLDVTPKHVSELLSGKATLSHQLALALERVTSIPARLWNQYEAGYRSDLARAAEAEELADQYEQARAFPLTYLRKWAFITAPARDRSATVSQLLALLGVANLEAFRATWERGSVAYRRAAIGREKGTELSTWLVLAERHHERIEDAVPFDREALASLIPSLRALTVDEPKSGVDRAVQSLRDVGVHLCFIPAVPGLGVHGATRWVNHKPIIQLSLLWKSDDQLWFTLFHELGHVLLHGDRGLFINGEDSKAEAEADQFASDVLIPKDRESLVPRVRDAAAIREAATALGVAPGIVLGRAQRLTHDYAWGHELRRKFEFRVAVEED